MRAINITDFQEFINKYKIKQEERASKGLGLQYFGPKEMQILLDKMPIIDAEPVRHGEWETYPSHANRRCSVCKIEWDKPKFDIRANYCPNCGAKMNLRKD